MENDNPVWEHGSRSHGFWIGTKQIGFIGISPPTVNPVVYVWSLNVPHHDVAKGECLSLRRAKRFVERAWAEQKVQPPKDTAKEV